MSDDSVAKATSKFDDTRFTPIRLSPPAPRKLTMLTPAVLEGNLIQFNKFPGSDEFILRLANAIMLQELDHALTLVREFYVRMNPPPLTENSLVSELPISVRIINSLESCGFERISALLPLTEAQLIDACRGHNFGADSAATVTKALEPLRAKYNRSRRTGLYDDLDEELMDEVNADRAFRGEHG